MSRIVRTKAPTVWVPGVTLVAGQTPGSVVPGTPADVSGITSAVTSLQGSVTTLNTNTAATATTVATQGTSLASVQTDLAAADTNITNLQSGVYTRVAPLSVSVLGDKITQRIGGNGNVLDLSTQTQAQSWANTVKTHGPYSYVMYGAMRADRAWSPFEYWAAGSNVNFTTAKILATGLPALLGNPSGKPDMCIVLAGMNDPAASITVAQTIANLKLIYQGLLAQNMLPIACSILPSTTTQLQNQQISQGVQRLADEMDLPFANFWKELADPATGAWAVSTYTFDGALPTVQGCMIMGAELHRAIQPFTNGSRRLGTGMFDAGAGATAQNRDPNLTTTTGTINAASSRPTLWNAPSTTSMSTVYDGAGAAEPGTGFTMRPALSSGIGGMPVRYIGKSWCLAGNGTNNGTNPTIVTGMAVSGGDKIALSFRLKAGFNLAPASGVGGGFRMMLQFGGTHEAGIEWMTPPTGSPTDGSTLANIGSETALPAGEFYFEWTHPASLGAGTLIPQFGIGRQDGVAVVSNTGDYVCVSNVELVNLTALGLDAP